MKRRTRFGLVLSGGGVYGAFQAGVLHSLYEEGIRFTSIAGTSAGALNAVLASSGDASPLSYWRRIPAVIARETELADVQWRAALRAFAKAEAIGQHAGRNYATRRAVEGAAGGGVLGAIVGGAARGWAGGAIGALVGGTLGAAAGFLFSGGKEEAERRGRRAALRYLNSVLDEFGDEAFLSVRAADALRSVAASAPLRTRVQVTVSSLDRFRGGHLLKLRDTKGAEVSPRGRYLTVKRDAVSEQVLASMAMPLVMGRRNNVNRTSFLDGGLYDNAPLNALSPEIGAGEVECILMLDVSQCAEQFRRRYTELAVPVLFVSLARPAGIAAARNILDFGQAPSLFRRGQKAGALALKRWFCNPRFDPMQAFEASASLLPESHVIQARQ